MNRRYANSAIVAIIIAMLGLFLDRLAPVLGMIAIVFAVFGLYWIRREPEYYRGRGFCWAAIALALIATALSLLVEPPMASSTPLSSNIVVPDNHTVG